MTKLCLKLVCSPTDEVRRVPLTLDYSELCGKLIPSLFADVFGPSSDVVVQYKDDEGDVVTISSSPELAEAVELARDVGLRSLRLTLRPATSRSPPRPVSGSCRALWAAIECSPPLRLPTRPATATSLYVHDAVARGAAAAARARAGTSAASHTQLLSEVVAGKPLRHTTPRVRQRPIVNPLADAAAAAASTRAGSFSAAAEGIDLQQALKARARRTAARAAAAAAAAARGVVPQVNANAADQDGQTLEQAIQATIDAFAARQQQQQAIACTRSSPELPLHTVHLATARAASAAAQNKKAVEGAAPAAPPAETSSDFVVVPSHKHQEQLLELARMGFGNEEANAALLESYQGRLDQVVNALLAGA